jgi:two-component system, OmpR family, response regulator
MTKSRNADTAAQSSLADRAVFVAGRNERHESQDRAFLRAAVAPGAIAVSRTEWQEVGTGNSPSSDPQQTGNDRQETVLVVDDDLTLQSMILDYFVDNNIRTLLASGRKEMLRHLSAQEVNVVILDLRLGLEDGLDVLRELRSSSDVPVIVITGQRRDEIDRVVGLELGADDYVTKPFNLRELLARVRAIIRRLDRARSSPAREPERGGYRFSGWQLPLRTRRLTDTNGGDVALTKGEYALLVAFLDAPQRPLSREHLLQATRVHEDVFDRSIDVQILRLRRKLEHDPSAPQMIQTERGVGYVFARQVERF